MSLSSHTQRLALHAIVRVVHFLPFSWLPPLGNAVGRLMMLGKKRLHITKANVDGAFPEASKEWKGAVVCGAYLNLGITLVELMKLGSISKEHLLERVEIRGLEEVRERLSQGKPSILVSGHMGNWEWMAAAAGLKLNHQITIVTHPQKNSQANAILNQLRTRFGNKLVPMREAARTLVRELSNGGVVAFLADQHASADRDPWIDFFGRPTPTYSAPAALSLRMGAPIFFGVAVRQEDHKYIVNVRRLQSDDLDSTNASVNELTRRHVVELEKAIRKQPNLWSWQHRRWRKPQPPSITAHDENRHATN